MTYKPTSTEDICICAMVMAKFRKEPDVVGLSLGVIRVYMRQVSDLSSGRVAKSFGPKLCVDVPLTWE